MRRTIGLSLALVAVSAVVLAKQAHSAQHQPSASAKEKHAKSDTGSARTDAKGHRAGNKIADRHASRHNAPAHRSSEKSGSPDQYVGPLQVVGTQETGSAAWYGPLARVTNLKNGRSVIVKVTDRGPWSANLLIDVSPRAAEELDMKRAGIVPVKIEPVLAARPTPQLASGASSQAD
jgi:rare lipoprotein A